MIKFKLTPKTNDKVIEYEEAYLSKCSRIVDSHRELCAQYGCELCCGLFWQVRRNYKFSVYTERPSFEQDYECWFAYSITKNGQPVCINEDEGYTLSESEGFLYIRKKKVGSFFRLKETFLEVTFIDDVSDLKKSIESDVSALKEFFSSI